MGQEIRQLQIIVGGLMLGLFTFMGIAAAIGPLSADGDSMQWLLLGIPVMALACATAYFAQKRALRREIRERLSELRDAASVPVAYRRFVVVGGGLIEGPGMFSVVAYLLTGHVLALCGAVLSLALLALHLPSVARWERLVEDESLA